MDPNITAALVGALVTGVFSVVTVLLARTQNKQRQDIDALTFLVTHFLPKWELEHLGRLARNESLTYDKVRFPNFEQEVRNLRDRELIQPRRNDFRLAELPPQGDLRDYYVASSSGRTYLSLREKSTTKPPAG